jgi:L-asparagine oxygenase
MINNIQETISRDGFAFLPAFHGGESTSQVVAHLGILARLPALDDIQQLSPKPPSQAPPNIYSGTFGLGTFPFHTDLAHWFLPPRYFALRCVVGSVLVKTVVFDGWRLVSEFGETRLRRGLVQPRRPVGLTKPLLRLLEATPTGDHRLRWDTLFVRPATTSSASLCEAIRSYLSSVSTIQFALAKVGDTLIVDNWRMLHGRSAVPPDCLDRRVERVYLQSLQ